MLLSCGECWSANSRRVDVSSSIHCLSSWEWRRAYTVRNGETTPTISYKYHDAWRISSYEFTFIWSGLVNGYVTKVRCPMKSLPSKWSCHTSLAGSFMWYWIQHWSLPNKKYVKLYLTAHSLGNVDLSWYVCVLSCHVFCLRNALLYLVMFSSGQLDLFSV